MLSSVALFSCPQSFPESGSFPVSQLFTSGGLSIGASASASVFPMNIQGWLPLGLTGSISLQSKGLTRVFPSTTIQKHQFFDTQHFPQSNSHVPLEKKHMTTGKSTALTIWSYSLVFSSELILCIGWLACWSFSFSNNPSNEYLGLISFRIDCFALLEVQGNLKSLLQHHN